MARARPSLILPLSKFTTINSVHARCIVKTSGFTRVFVKIADFIEFKGFLVEFLDLENRRS